MNERIQELLVEAHRQTNGGIYSGHLSEWSEKFAQFIVQECIQVCSSRVGNSDYNTGRMHCASDIKEHFGVE